MKYFIYSFLLFIFIGCQSNPQQSDFDFENVFFNLTNYFETEIEKNTKQFNSVTKTSIIDTDSNTVQLNSIDFSKELKLFIESDINKMSWADRYQIDSLVSSPTEYTINYTALSDKLQTRKVSILFADAIPQKIEIHNELNSMIMDTDQYLTYLPGIGYDINITQIGKLQEGHDYSIAVRFNK